MTRTWIISAVLSLCIGVTFADSQTPASAKIPRPTLFAPDDENRGFEDAVPPSDIVLDALLNTAEAQDASEELKALGRESKRKLFSVVRIQIGGINEEDYIVTGRQPMSGADDIWFWIVRVKQGKGRVLLFANGLTVEILHGKTNGYHDIREVWGGNAGVITRLYRYNGSNV